MHEHEGAICKTTFLWINAKIAAAGKKTLRPETEIWPRARGSCLHRPLEAIGPGCGIGRLEGGAGPGGCRADAGEGRRGGPGTLAARSTRAGRRAAAALVTEEQRRHQQVQAAIQEMGRGAMQRQGTRGRGGIGQSEGWGGSFRR